MWKWNAATRSWSMIRDDSKPGYVAGKAPGTAGTYDGQIIRVASVPKSP
jgi:hypothetical protein